MDLGLKGKVAIVTGGSHGIGGGICEILAQEGCNIVANYNSTSAEKAEAFAKRLEEEYGVKAIAVQADITDEENVIALFSKTYEVFGTVDILVNNANFMNGSNGPIEKFDVKKFRVAEAAVVEAMFVTSRELIKHCRANNKPGHIVNVITKTVWWSSSVDNSPYVAVKGACAAVTRSLAHEVASDNIWVNGIIPGYVMVEKTMLKPDRVERTVKKIPSGRYATPKEMGNVVAFLCSEAACEINGGLIDCSGGTLIGDSNPGRNGR